MIILLLVWLDSMPLEFETEQLITSLFLFVSRAKILLIPVLNGTILSHPIPSYLLRDIDFPFPGFTPPPPVMSIRPSWKESLS